MMRSLSVLLLVLIGCSGEKTDPCADQAPGTACSWAGLKGQEGFSRDENVRWDLHLSQPQDLLFLPDGSAWVSDFNNFLIRRILPDGTVENVVGWTDPIFPGDGPLGGIPEGGAPGSEWQLNHPTNLLLTPEGMVLVVAWHNHKLLEVDPDSGWVKVVCGAGSGFAGDGGPASAALFKQPNDATIDEAGNIYVVDQQNQRIRMIDTSDTIDTIAGDGTAGYLDGPGPSARFSWAVGSNPNPSGGITNRDGVLYISDTMNHRIRAMDLATGEVTTIAGTGVSGYSGDGGPALGAQIAHPMDIEFGPDGDLYFADTDNGAIRAIDLDTGIIRTVVGTGSLGLDDEENLPAEQTQLRRPFGVSFDPEGNLYVLDSLNSRIVKVAR